MIRAIAITLIMAATATAATFTDVTQTNVLIRTASTWNEIETGYSQRAALFETFGYPADSTAEPGGGMQVNRAYPLANYLQAAVSNLVYEGWYTGTNMPSAATNFPVYTNWVEFCQDAGLSTNGFRRATSYHRATDDWTAVDDAMWTREGNVYGFAQDGDIIGPWLIDDLQRALSRLDIAVKTPVWYAGGVTNAGFSGSLNGQTTWSSAVTGALAAYPSSPYVANSDRPLSRFTGRYYYSVFFGGYRYQAATAGWFNRALWNAGDNGTNALAVVQALGGDVGFYAFSIVSSLHTGYDQQFDANGTGLIEDTFARFSTASFTGGGTNQYHYSGWLNDSVAAAAPPTCDEPDSGTPDRIKGFQVTGEKALIRLNWSHTR